MARFEAELAGVAQATPSAGPSQVRFQLSHTADTYSTGRCCHSKVAHSYACLLPGQYLAVASLELHTQP